MPMWISEDSALTLQVSSTHYKADNSKNLGVFNIEMPIETAKCLWGVDLSKAISATVAALYPELGISELVTTASKVEGKFFKVTASGFHFSAPTIKVKVVQINPELATEKKNQVSLTEESKTPTFLAPATAVKKRITITCIKGKLTKKITGVNAKCPKGYKKK